MAAVEIGWATVAANSSFHFFVHGWGPGDAVTYSLVVHPGRGEGVRFPKAHATLTQGEHFRHVDGTFAQRVHIRNNAPFNSCNIRLLAMFERV